MNAPNEIAIWSEQGPDNHAAEIEWRAGAIWAQAPRARLCRVALRWNHPIAPHSRILGDHWERGYGDLEWRGIIDERPLPWMALVHDPQDGTTLGLGVKTGGASFASWRVDANGFTLVLDVRTGGRGVQLGGRDLCLAECVQLDSQPDEGAFALARRLCQALCDHPRLPAQPVYGGNDWYHRYGRISESSVKLDAGIIADLAPDGPNRPTYVIDAGWYPAEGCDGGPYLEGNERFPDLSGLATSLKDIGVHPGIWIRPLQTNAPIPDSWKLEAHGSGLPLDPTVPEVLALVREDIQRLVRWGYEVIKHDFTTFDVLGHWGFQMGADVARGNWAFADQTRTTAEILRALYQTIREAAGDAMLIGCNTVGHLGAGLFEMQRTGDDTSGRNWERTRKMGINTLTFRMPQHETFFHADADCVGITDAIPWEKNEQWLRLVALSGTPLFVSVAPESLGQEQRDALRDAFHVASSPQTPAVPLDWMETTSPRRWLTGQGEVRFDWGEWRGSSLATEA
ncbi:MAG: hypothetical protein ACOYON_15200 [Fimbriimonas sp.]